MPTLADINYNPGNLRDVTTGNFRQFNSEGEGYAALMNDLQGKVTGNTRTGLNGGSTLYDFAQKYAPSGDNNNPAQYTANLANSLGVRPDTKLSELQSRIPDFAQAIAKNEGYTGAKGFKSAPKAQTQTPPVAPPTPEKPSVGGFLGNVISAGANAIGGVTNAVMHPIKTAESLYSTAEGGAQAGVKAVGDLLTGGKYTANGGAGMPKTNEENQWDAFTGMLKDRYGSLDAIKNTLYKDPVGVAMDIASVLEGGAGLVGEAADAAKLGTLGKVAEIGEAGDVVRPAVEASGLAGAAQKVSEVAKEANPINLAGKAVGAVAGKVGDVMGGAGEKLPGQIMNSILKPGIKEFNFGKNPGTAVANEGITASSKEGLLNKIISTKKSIGENIGTVLKSAIGKDKTIDVGKIINDSISEDIQSAIKSGDVELGRRLVNIKKGLTEEFVPDETSDTGMRATGVKKDLSALSPNDANEIKKQIGEDTHWTNQAYDNEVNQSRVKIYGQINDAVKQAVPSVGGLNDRYANLLGAQKSLEHTIKIGQKNPFPVGMKDIATVGLGFAKGGTAGALVAEGLKIALGTTLVKTWGSVLLNRVSNAISEVSPNLAKTIIPQIAKYPADALRTMSDAKMITLIKDITSTSQTNMTPQ